MCGIAGISRPKTDEGLRHVLENMSAKLVHRGPDDDGVVIAPNHAAGLAHRRLSIIDLSSHGRQPFISEDKTLALVCNGEIYNHRELRQELERKGHRFTSNSDSEVVLHLYEEMGREAVHRLRGMFAFAILDLTTGDLFCARDPLGKKPLYYVSNGQGFAFASEIPAFMSVPDIDWTLDSEAIALYLLRNLRHIPAPWTIYKSIRALPAGHCMQVTKARISQIWRYWKPDLAPMSVSPDRLLEELDCAVERRSVADVEIAALLSGGVDSTALIDSLNRQGGKTVRTFAFGRDANDEEILRARKASELLNTSHREIYFDPERQHDLFDDLIVRHGQPISALPLTHAMMMFEAIREEGFKVVMAGHGADEVFYGYDGAQALCGLARLETLVPRALARWGAAVLSPGHGGRLAEALCVLSHVPGQRKESLYKAEASRLWPSLMQAPPADELVHQWCRLWFDDTAPGSYIDEAAFLGLVEENAHAITTAGDLPAMAHGIEVRCPFLDQDLVEMGLKIPYSDKVGRRCSEGKLILKLALQQRLPKDILFAPKRGFGYFVQEEGVYRGAWKARIDDAFANPNDCQGILNVDALRIIKRRFDENDQSVPTILMAKLYALQRFASLNGVG